MFTTIKGYFDNGQVTTPDDFNAPLSGLKGYM